MIGSRKPSPAKPIEQRLSLHHIGIAGTRSESRHLVTAVLPNSPAARAGIRRGDELLAVDGSPYQPIRSFNPATSRASLAAESPRQLRIARGGTEREVTLTPVFNNLFDAYRSAVAPSTQQFSVGNKLIGYVRLWGISRNANDLAALRQLMTDFRTTSSLIVDLRNAEGFLGREHLQLFLPGGFDNYYSSPIALIIDQSTTGAAEAFAEELARLERATSVGAAAAGGLQPELAVPWPLAGNSANDPQFETALGLLAGLL